MALPRSIRLLMLGGVSLLGLVETLEGAPAPRRGDVDEDGNVTITDGINVLGFLFLSSSAPYCQPVADANGDGVVNITDPVLVLNYLFLGNVDLPALSEAELDECGANSLPPSFPPRDVYRAYPGFLVEFPLGAVDPEGDSLLYEAAGPLPAGASIDPDTGILSWTPSEADVGRVTVTCAVLDEKRPPNRVEGEIVLDVLPLESCMAPQCDPALGCHSVPVEDLASACCGDPGARVEEPEVECPQGAALHIGRNSAGSPTIGRLQSCDRLRVASLAQGGTGVHLNIEARCIDASFLVDIHVRLETATTVLVNRTITRSLTLRPDGYFEARSMGMTAVGQFTEGAEAHLTITLKDSSDKEIARRVRVVLTKDLLQNLP